MISTLLVAWALVVVTVTVHAAGLTVCSSPLMKSMASPPSSYLAITRRLIQVTWSLILIHLADIRCGDCSSGGRTACRTSSRLSISPASPTRPRATATFVAGPWRMLGPIEALTGILMCGLSAAVFFAVVSRIFIMRRHTRGECQTDPMKFAAQGNPAQPAALAAGLRAGGVRRRASQARIAHAAVRAVGPCHRAAGGAAEPRHRIGRRQDRRCASAACSTPRWAT